MDSILTTDEWYYSSRVLKTAVGIFGLAFLLTLGAYSTPYWLESVPSEQLPRPKFNHIGK